MAEKKTPAKTKSKSSRSKAAQIQVTLVRSLHGQLKSIAASARGLGLRRINQSVTVSDTPEIRGMIRAATHLLKVEEPAAK